MSLRPIIAAYAIGLSLSNPSQAAEEKWQPLLDEKLSQWEVWLGRPHPSIQGLAPELSAPGTDGKKKTLGLNNDPRKVFTASLQDGEPVLRITGEIWGGLTTLESFSNYHFRTQIKWGETKWEPRLDKVRDNGILYHCTGPHGAGGGNWKKSLEFQVQEMDMGDFWPVAGVRADIRATLVDGKYFYDPAAEALRFGEAGEGVIKSHVAHLKGDFEKPHGGWNTLDLYVIGRDAIHVVNGKVVLAVRNAAAVEGPEKKETPLAAGQIQIQSEAAECFYRRMEIRPLEAFPEEMRKAANF